MTEFKFQVGQVVQHKATGMRLVVTTRLSEESVGGLVPAYCAGGHNRDGELVRAIYGEVELEPCKPSTLAESLTWVKEVAMAEQDFETAASVRALIDKVIGRRAKERAV